MFTSTTTSLSQLPSAFLACILSPLLRNEIRRLLPEILDEVLVERERRNDFSPDD